MEKVPESNKAKIEECEEMSKKMAETVEKEQTNYDEALATLQAETQEFQDKKEKLETELITLQVGCKCILSFILVLLYFPMTCYELWNYVVS